MAAINNFNGTPVKDGKVVYSEQLDDRLYFNVILMYEPYYEGKNDGCYQGSTRLLCEAVITTGERDTHGNGIISLKDAEFVEHTENDKTFNPLREPLQTKDGFRVWQVAYDYGGFEINNIKYKNRRVKWIVEVPKLSLLQLCIKNQQN